MPVPPPFRRPARRFAAWRDGPLPPAALGMPAAAPGMPAAALGMPPPPPPHTPGQPPEPVAAATDPVAVGAAVAAADMGLTPVEQAAAFAEAESAADGEERLLKPSLAP